jgi:hypothetical protein
LLKPTEEFSFEALGKLCAIAGNEINISHIILYSYFLFFIVVRTFLAYCLGLETKEIEEKLEAEEKEEERKVEKHGKTE